MNIVDIIAKKRDGNALSKDEIRFFVQGVTSGSIPDYQASAWLMATFLRGMTPQETLDLTLAMRDSGQVLDIPERLGITLDKHSTGGVGDKTTLVVVPILAAAGVPMLKMSGRGLGFSGGTVDKLESIPGFRTELTIAEALAQVEKVGAALIAQTGELAPADKILYGLRDVTATVECIPLIASSIMSKKLAGGAKRIVLDVKVGRGAFMKTEAQAEALAHALVEIGNGAGIPTAAVLTRMDEPLGYAVGNGLEVKEALDALRIGEGKPADKLFLDLCCHLAAHSFTLLGHDKKFSTWLVNDKLLSGDAPRKFAEIVAAQGGAATIEEIEAGLPRAPIQHNVLAKEAGYVSGIDAETIGKLSVQMGAGRLTKGEAIDHAVGIVLHKKTGDAVSAKEQIAMLHCREADELRLAEFEQTLCSAYTFSKEKPPQQNSLIIKTIEVN